MLDLANKCVLIRTHEEYENILKVAKKQGYRWYGGKETDPYIQRQIDYLKAVEKAALDEKNIV